MLTSLDALEVVAPDCQKLPGAADFIASRHAAHDAAVAMCGPGTIKEDGMRMGNVRKLSAALRKIKHYEEKAKKEKGLAEKVLDASLIHAGGVTGFAGMDAVEAVLNAHNLGDVSDEAVEGGTTLDSDVVSSVVTVEDLRVIQAEVLGEDPDSLVLQESPPMVHISGDRMIVQGDMRVPRNHAELLQKRKRRAMARARAGKYPEGLAIHLRGKSAAWTAPLPRVSAGETWQDGQVRYCFSPRISDGARRAFTEAVQHVNRTEARECLSFEEVQCEGPQRGIVFVHSNEPDACWSDVGFAYQGNELNLGSGCESQGIALHELGHTLGMDHEQARPDRDQYVTVHLENVRPGFENQFGINPEAYTGEPYDYLSIMHYGAFTFSRERSSLPTLTAVQSNASGAFGQAMGLSRGDVKQLGDMYCPEHSWVQSMAAALSSASPAGLGGQLVVAGADTLTAGITRSGAAAAGPGGGGGGAGGRASFWLATALAALASCLRHAQV